VCYPRGPGRTEAQLPFAGLIDLCDGLGIEALALPGPQRAALEVALLRAEPMAVPAQPHAIALGALHVLHVLRVVGGGAPLVVAIDDVQWLDAPSADALAFAARRRWRVRRRSASNGTGSRHSERAESRHRWSTIRHGRRRLCEWCGSTQNARV
jgi:hypothetical protein